MRKKPRRGLRRVIVHIIALALLGAIALPLGLAGDGMLGELTQSESTPARTNALIENSRKGLIDIITANFERRDQNKLKNPITGIETKVAQSVTEQVNAGLTDSEIALAAVDMFASAAINNVSNNQELHDSFNKLLAEKKPALVDSARESAEIAVRNINKSYVRERMSVTATKNYAVMYYSSVLIWVGAIALLLAALLAVLWFKNDEDGRVKIAVILEPIDYLLPFLIGVSVFTLYPMIRTAVMSFQYMYHPGLSGATEWGIGNYKFVLFGVEGTSNVFLQGLKNTAMYVALTIPISTALSIIIAYLLNQKIKGNGIFQTAYFLPMVTTVTAVGLIWRYIFNQRFGLMNAIVTGLGGAPQDWLGSHPMTVLVVFGVWSSLPFTIILLLSGLQNIDDNLYTVAKVDGSGGARIFFRITVPLLSPTIGLVLIINSISAFKVYTDVMVLWKGTPQDSGMQTVTWYIYDQIQAKPDGIHTLGFAAAAAMVLFLIIFAFTMLQKLIQRKWVYQ